MPDGLAVTIDLLQRQHGPLRPLSARIPHHSRAATDQDDGRVTEALKPSGAHDWDEVSDVQRVRGGIESDVGRYRAFGEPSGQSRGRILKQASSRQNIEQFRHSGQWYPLE